MNASISLEEKKSYESSNNEDLISRLSAYRFFIDVHLIAEEDFQVNIPTKVNNKGKGIL
jgi:hypothetical protein